MEDVEEIFVLTMLYVLSVWDDIKRKLKETDIFTSLDLSKTNEKRYLLSKTYVLN